jgi:hypothetical protein
VGSRLLTLVVTNCEWRLPSDISKFPIGVGRLLMSDEWKFLWHACMYGYVCENVGRDVLVEHLQLRRFGLGLDPRLGVQEAV